MWQSAYQGIYRSNVVINRVQEADQGDYDDYMAEKFRNRLEAEARFTRALLYFNMVRFFGDVPLILEERDDFENINTPRTDSKLVYDQIIEDLQFAETHLYGPNWYTSETVDIDGEARPLIPSYDLEDFGRPTFSAAKGLLAKVYLTRASWPLNETAYFTLAEEKANEVIDSNIYQLADNYHELLSPEGKDQENGYIQLNLIMMDYKLHHGEVSPIQQVMLKQLTAVLVERLQPYNFTENLKSKMLEF